MSLNTPCSGMRSATTTESDRIVGALGMDISDRTGENLVRRGTAQDEASNQPEKNAEKLEKASAKLFNAFPPGSFPEK
jgi:hypothetical protein